MRDGSPWPCGSGGSASVGVSQASCVRVEGAERAREDVPADQRGAQPAGVDRPPGLGGKASERREVRPSRPLFGREAHRGQHLPVVDMQVGACERIAVDRRRGLDDLVAELAQHSRRRVHRGHRFGMHRCADRRSRGPTDAQPRRRLANELPPRARRGRGGDAGIAGLGAGEQVERERAVAHAARDHAFAGGAEPELAEPRTHRDAPARGLEHEQAAAGRRRADRRGRRERRAARAAPARGRAARRMRPRPHAPARRARWRRGPGSRRAADEIPTRHWRGPSANQRDIRAPSSRSRSSAPSAPARPPGPPSPPSPPAAPAPTKADLPPAAPPAPAPDISIDRFAPISACCGFSARGAAPRASAPITESSRPVFDPSVQGAGRLFCAAAGASGCR